MDTRRRKCRDPAQPQTSQDHFCEQLGLSRPGTRLSCILEYVCSPINSPEGLRLLHLPHLPKRPSVPWQTRCGSKSRDTRARSPPTYAVQCIFAHNYITQTFLEEQKMKPDLCKRIEGMTATDVTTLEKHFPHVAKIAPEIVAAVASNDFAITDKRLEPQFLWAGGIGSSPKRGWGVVDSLLALLASLLFPLIRRDIEKKCQGDAFRSE